MRQGWLSFIVASVQAQQGVYPAKGQLPEQQKKDEYECHQRAGQQTGVDPTVPQRQAAATPKQPTTLTV